MLLEIDKSNAKLALAELHSLCKKVELIEEGILLAKIKNLENTGYVKKGYEVLGTLQKMKKVKGSFKAISHTKLSNKEFAKKIWENTSKKVDLKNPDNELHLFQNLVVKKIYERKLEKKSNEWKKNHPTSTDPKISKAMINIARAKKVFDPFCGAGGILIEANRMKKKSEGIDIDEIQIKRAKENLEELGFKSKLTVANSFKKKWPRIIVTDLPYGRNSKIQENFYDKFFDKVKECNRAVVGLPASIKVPRKMLKFETEIYIHKGLTKKIILLEH